MGVVVVLVAERFAVCDPEPQVVPADPHAPAPLDLPEHRVHAQRQPFVGRVKEVVGAVGRDPPNVEEAGRHQLARLQIAHLDGGGAARDQPVFVAQGVAPGVVGQQAALASVAVPELDLAPRQGRRADLDGQQLLIAVPDPPLRAGAREARHVDAHRLTADAQRALGAEHCAADPLVALFKEKVKLLGRESGLGDAGWATRDLAGTIDARLQTVGHDPRARGKVVSGLLDRHVVNVAASAPPAQYLGGEWVGSALPELLLNFPLPDAYVYGREHTPWRQGEAIQPRTLQIHTLSGQASRHCAANGCSPSIGVDTPD